MCSYASSAAPYCVLNEQADKGAVVQALNENAIFGNCTLASLQTTTFVSIGRLHDKARQHNHLANCIKVMSSQSTDCGVAAAALQAEIMNQKQFIEKILDLRHKLFAHTDVDAPLVAAFGFEELTTHHFRGYWNEIMSAMELCDAAMFGTREHAPKFDKSLFGSIEQATKNFLLNLSAQVGEIHRRT
jgi:hypothetical protein